MEYLSALVTMDRAIYTSTVIRTTVLQQCFDYVTSKDTNEKAESLRNIYVKKMFVCAHLILNLCVRPIF